MTDKEKSLVVGDCLQTMKGWADGCCDMTKKLINTGIKYFGSTIMLSSSGDPITDLALKEGFCAQFWLAGAPADSWAIDHLLSVAEKRLAEARGDLIS